MKENDPLGLLQNDERFFPEEPSEKDGGESYLERMFTELSKEARHGKT